MAGVYARGPISQQLLTNVSDDETLSPWIDVRGASNLVFYVTSTGTTSGGVISFEEASPSNFATAANPPMFGAATDGYSLITTQNASTTSGGKQVAIHLTPAAYAFVRARISTAISGGGSVSVGLVAV